MLPVTFLILHAISRMVMCRTEAARINVSLLMLGIVIAQLAGSRNRRWLPFRNSKLTRLLQPSIGGNSRTVIIATVHPGKEHADVTAAALRFASRVMQVQNVYGVSESYSAAQQAKQLPQDMDKLIAPVLHRQIASLEDMQSRLQDEVWVGVVGCCLVHLHWTHTTCVVANMRTWHTNVRI